MKPVLLMDFGSTYTKVTAVDVDSETLLGTASSYTTVQTDIGEGLQNALNILEQKTGKLDFSERYACSSAAGGLRMITRAYRRSCKAGFSWRWGQGYPGLFL